MSENLEMEKNKNFHPANPVSKTVNSDKSKDASKFNKNGRGRGNCPNRQDFYQNKKTPQRIYHKGFDKRLKSRSWNSFPNDRIASQEVKDEAEIGSVQNPGSRKGGSNASHLLNFTFSSNRDATSFHTNKHEYGWRVGRRKHFNKEQFLQANFKFVVKSNGDYTVHQADPDVLVDWSLVEEVQLPCCDEPKCPICLDYPLATKMTQCGHFYCWPCILHYLALSDKSYRKCPICDESVRKNDLKSVVFLLRRSYSVDDEITMELMCKERGTVQAIPLSSKHLYMNGLPSLAKGNENLPFVKLFIASAQQVLDVIIKREEDDLKRMLVEDGDSPESCFIHEALELLNCRKEETLKSLFNQRSLDIVPTCDDNREEYLHTKPKDYMTSKINYVNAFEDIKITDDEIHNTSSNEIETSQQVLNGNVDIIKESETEGTQKVLSQDTSEIEDIQDVAPRHVQIPKDVYYFYQAADGQPIYLHPLNVKMLIEEYGSLKVCPSKVTAKIVQIEGNTMDENLRNRFRYLNHLPLHCEYLVAELKFNNIVSKKTYEKFFEDIKKRKHMRQNKKKVERRWELKVKSDENKKKGLFPSASVDLGCLKQFPTCNDTVTEDADIASHGSPDSPSHNYDLGMASTSVDSSTQASFAQMLQNGKVKQAPVWPNIGATVSPKAKAHASSDDDDECSSVPNYKQSFCDDIPSFHNYPEEGVQETATGKKKKFKKKILFSTSMNRTK